MPCLSPLAGWKSRQRNPSGKRAVVFNPKDGYTDQPVEVPCGRCIGCKIVKGQQWALRCQHEAALHHANCFLTLTYETSPGTLVKEDLQAFFCRLRERLRNRGLSFRYFGVGEYGPKFIRPHYHALIFGYDFDDKQLWGGSPTSPLYRSKELEQLWPFGHSTVAPFSAATARYVSKYTTKIWKHKDAAHYYGDRKPEFAIMSRRPGLGKGWIDKYKSDVFPRDFVVTPGGAKVAVPRFYLSQLSEKEQRRIKARRQQVMTDHPDARGERAVAKAIFAEAGIKRATRRYENEDRSV